MTDLPLLRETDLQHFESGAGIRGPRSWVVIVLNLLFAWVERVDHTHPALVNLLAT